jgi:hypothetical protein
LPRASYSQAQNLAQLSEASLGLGRRKEALEAARQGQRIFARLSDPKAKREKEGLAPAQLAEAAVTKVILEGTADALEGKAESAAAAAERLIEAQPRNPGIRYNAASLYGLATSGLGGGKRPEEWPDDVKRLHARYAGRAMELLGQAEKAGLLADAGFARHLKRAPDFDPLRTRKDFQALLQRIDKK